MTAASYRAIKADIMAGIAEGRWPPGALMPSEQELARDYEAARATISRAMRELAEEGLIERKRRAGTRVRAAPRRQARFDIPLVRKEIEERGAAYRYALTRSDILQAPDWLRARMGLAPGGEARHLVCLHFADGHPYQLEDRWISLASTPEARAADFTSESPNEWLVRRVPFSNAEISFSAVAATADEAKALGCALGEALFCAERQTWWRDQAVTYVRLLFQRGHRMSARY